MKNNLVSIEELSAEIVSIENQLAIYKELEKKEKDLKQKLFEAMTEHNIKKWETPNGTKITLVSGTDDKMEWTFDEKRFKEEKPLEYAEYCREVCKPGRSGYVRITTGGVDND